MDLGKIPALSRRRLLIGLAATALSFVQQGRGLLAIAGTAAQQAPGGVTALAFDQSRLVLAAQGIWTSSDGGATFTRTGAGPGAPIAALAIHPDQVGVIYAATRSGGLMRSRDAGLSWQPAGPGLPTVPIDAVALAAHDPRIIYVALRGDGIWHSVGAAETWEFAMDRPLVDGVEADIQVLASVGTLSGMGGYWVFAGTAKGVSKVPDCFCRWSPLESTGLTATLAKDAAPVVIDPALRLPHLSVSSLALAPSTPEVLFAGLPSGIWKSADSGATWRLMSPGIAAPLLAVAPLDPNHVIAAATNGAILSSRDGGITWAAPAAV